MNENFETIFKKNYNRLYTLAFRLTGNIEDSEDILQTAFINAYKAFNNFKYESSVYTWLYKIVLNTSKKFYKEARKLPVEVYSEAHNISQADAYQTFNKYGQVEDNAIAALVRENCLQMFMNCMPPKYRSVYTLRIILNFSVKETAGILDIKENTVKVNLHRAKSIIKAHFKGRCSLIKPGSMCDCRTYAKFIIEQNNRDALLDIKVIKNKEKKAVEEYKKELREMLVIEDLYNTEIKAIHYSDFLKRIKDKNFKLLDY